MRTRCAVLLALLIAMSFIAASGAAASTALPGSDYPWAQPRTAIVDPSVGHPPATIPVTTPVLVAAVPGSGYVWAQPGTSLAAVTSAQPPASTRRG